MEKIWQRSWNQRLECANCDSVKATRPKVFLLDDEPAVRALALEALERCGFDVRGGDQWAKLAQELFALKDDDVFLVSDLALPGIRGEDFCRTVQRYRPGVKIVIFTGSEPAHAGAVIQRLGAVTLVLKHDGVSALCDALRRLAAPGTTP